MRDESHEGISVFPRGFFSTQMGMLKRGQPSGWPELEALLSLCAHEIPATHTYSLYHFLSDCTGNENDPKDTFLI